MIMAATDREILLETGTNELELMEYHIGHLQQAINVLKIRRIVEYKEETFTPVNESHPAVVGIIRNEGDVITVIDLRTFYGMEPLKERKNLPIMITEFNEKQIGFLMDKIVTIRRLMWTDLKPITQTSKQSYITAIAPSDNGKDLALADFESIVKDIFQEEEPVITSDPSNNKKRSEIKIAAVDDSITIQKMIKKILEDNGYSNVRTFSNGQEAYDAVVKAQNPDEEEKAFDVIVSDIEMPMMDGLTLCKRIKDKIPGIKVAIVSSLISDQLIKKCQSVRADVALPKSQVDKIVRELDDLMNITNSN